MVPTGECNFAHIHDDDVRAQIREKAHAIRLEVWNGLPDAAKKDPKCSYAEKALAYEASKKKGG